MSIKLTAIVSVLASFAGAENHLSYYFDSAESSVELMNFKPET